MAETRRNLLVGAVVLVGLGILGSLIIMFGRGPTWMVAGRAYDLNVRFDRVVGIRAGTQVTVHGIAVGRVERVELYDPADFGAGVNVVVSIDDEYRIPAGSRACTTEPVLGQGRPPIEIIPGPAGAGYLQAGAFLNGTTRTAIDSIFPPGVVTTFQTAARQIGDAAEELTPVLTEVRNLVAARTPEEVDRMGGPPGNLASALARMDSALKHYNEVLGDGEVKSQIRDVIANFHDMSEHGQKVVANLEEASGESRELVSDARRLVGKTETALDQAQQQFTDVAQATVGTLDRADRFLDRLDQIGEKVNSGEGTLGRFVTDARLYEALLLSTERLTLALDDFRALIAEWREGKVRVAF